MMYRAIYNDDYLAHHGILGQKWGIRRYQNSDGSLTDAGRKRYGDDGQKKASIKGAYYGHKLAKQKKWTEYNKKDITTLSKPEWEKGVVNKKGETILSRDELMTVAKDEVKRSKAKEREYAKKEKEAYANSKITRQQLDKAISVGTKVAAGALAAYGVYKVSQIAYNKNEKFRNAVDTTVGVSKDVYGKTKANIKDIPNAAKRAAQNVSNAAYNTSASAYEALSRAHNTGKAVIEEAVKRASESASKAATNIKNKATDAYNSPRVQKAREDVKTNLNNAKKAAANAAYNTVIQTAATVSAAYVISKLFREPFNPPSAKDVAKNVVRESTRSAFQGYAWNSQQDVQARMGGKYKRTS